MPGMTPPFTLRQLPLPVLAAPLPGLGVDELVALWRLGFAPSVAAGPGLAAWLDRLTGAGVAAFAVHLPPDEGEGLSEAAELCVTYRAPILIGGGAPRAATARAARSFGGMLLHQVDSEADAHAALAAGAQGLSLLPAPRANFTLLRAVRRWFRGPLVLAGMPFLRGASVLAAQSAGADIVQARVTPAEAERHRAAWAGRPAGP